MASKFKAVTIGDLDGFAIRATCFLRGQVLLTTPKYKTGPMFALETLNLIVIIICNLQKELLEFVKFNMWDLGYPTLVYKKEQTTRPILPQLQFIKHKLMLPLGIFHCRFRIILLGIFSVAFGQFLLLFPGYICCFDAFFCFFFSVICSCFLLWLTIILILLSVL